MQKYSLNSWPIDALPRAESRVPGRDMSYTIASPDLFAQATGNLSSSRLSDEDMIIRGIEDPKYLAFGNFD